ncbi:hypothetical protein [Emticicia sp. 21SJ11W-3]|uniref:hypothetical protein n=1 Tax=Emticicia sp. 21SJ11W-3 TaxID=2916755 RepID=UPI0020A1810B|nr:hypothetical protein [Emticicia sp. 21SJ11W-3]UTA69485.1 hypothetical protein MB380_06660 [Emticicia sp. 21SJ11W-3]
MNQVKHIISGVRFQLYAVAFFTCLLVAVSAFLLVSVFSDSLSVSLISSLLAFGLSAYQTQLFKDKQNEAVRLIHKTVGDTEYSLQLLNLSQPNIAEQLQLERLASKLEGHRTPTAINSKIWVPIAIAIVSMLIYLGYPLIKQHQSKETLSTEAHTKASPQEMVKPPVFSSAQLTITPPAYTQLPTKTNDDLNASAISGSMLKWLVAFNHTNNLAVKLSNNRGEELAFRKTGEVFEYTDMLQGSGLYAIKAYWKDSLIFQSDYYRLEAIPDLAPRIDPASKELYKFHFLKDPKTVQISAKISDDFQVTQAFIIATVARGSGENVKFREIKLPIYQAHFKEAFINKTIDLKALNFAPGDELYYYWAAIDNKKPEPNYTKSDTYFIVYKDTSKTEEAEMATMAMNILPEYFRSQRQIIIDTEKLIAKRNKISLKDFKSTSNEIGFDQKALRLRYGQYLGEEFENSIGGGDPIPSDAISGSAMGGDLLKGFTHAHDEGEHDHEDGEKHQANGHSHDHVAETKGNQDNEDPLAAILKDYVHSHDDGEANTFYEQSTRSLLKMSLEQMWQSELHLRLYEPEKALPFEKKALEFLKSAQQKARTFVKKTSFDPPPIKEKEKRMTGELTKFNEAFSYEKNFSQQKLELLVAQVLGIIDTQKEGQKLNGYQKQSLLLLGTYLSGKIMNSKLSNWSVLSQLQNLINDKDLSTDEKAELKTKLYQLTGITQPKGILNKSYSAEKKLEKAFWKNIR